jgi:hypothetical protein
MGMYILLFLLIPIIVALRNTSMADNMYDIHRSVTDWSPNAVHIVYHMMLFLLCFDMCHSSAYLSPTKINIAHRLSPGAY